MKRFTKTSLAACMASALFAGSAHAALVASPAPLAPSIVIDFQQFTSVVLADAVPVQIGVPVSEDVELFGLGTYGTSVGPVNMFLSSNGTWNSVIDPDFRSAQLGITQSVAMEYVFNTAPVRGVGGFMNYDPDFSPTVLIEVFDAGGFLLESYDLVIAAPINTPPTSVNQGAFRGILRATSDITSFRVTANYAALDDLTFTRVPEPASASLLRVLGLVPVARLRRSQP